MARVKVAKVMEHLKSDMRKALEEAMRRTFPGMEYNKHALYRNFEHAVRRRCSGWETVSDTAVEKN